MELDRPLTERTDGATVFEVSRAVRTGDIDADRRLRLDGVARYLQDIGIDNLEALDVLDSHPLWIVRRTVIDVVRPAVWPEHLDLSRWCTAFSTRWAAMRVRIEGDKGALIETEGFWINISPDSGMPTRMSDSFIEAIAGSTDEHRLKWKRILTEPLPEPGPDVEDTPFPLRATDIDPFDHVNNAVYCQAIEEVLGSELRTAPHRAVIEYLAPIQSSDKVVLRTRRDDSAVTVWFLVEDSVRAVARVGQLPN
ncbi:acyl-[acyl-carrier-protein] thioesterase [Rhodococcus sp. NPDC058521]|uniref:acyl-[acyl-carrier-protein] thioesterase n=1 Tax=Rhodococcus sp. NPDC058521 TaxID=3346536 RepID=UPI00365FEA9E